MIKFLFLKTISGNLSYAVTEHYCIVGHFLTSAVSVLVLHPNSLLPVKSVRSLRDARQAYLLVSSHSSEARPLQAREVEGKKRGLYTDAGLDSPQLRASTTTRPYKMSMFFFLPPYSSLMHRVVIEGRPWGVDG